jgi:predicted RNA-binding Zn-ribbon protein involved in translation (DUF1610 family)
VVAYQKVTMAADGECAACGAELRPGDEASLAVTSRPTAARFVCPNCVSNPQKPEET